MGEAIFPVSPEFEEKKRKEAEYLNTKGPENPRCPHCKDRGYIHLARDGSVMVRYCACRELRRAEALLAASGLTEKLKQCTLSAFVTEAVWQKEMLEMARRYLAETLAEGDTAHRKNEHEAGGERPGQNRESKRWFFVGGQVGGGKTHLCTAMLGKMMDAGWPARYVVWPEEVDLLKANSEGFAQRLEKLCAVKVLYIDDFLKAPSGQVRGEKAPSAGEMAVAIKLLNHRYLRPGLVTVISSEWYMAELMEFDAGMASRVFERCGCYRLEIGRDGRKNMRIYLTEAQNGRKMGDKIY